MKVAAVVVLLAGAAFAQCDSPKYSYAQNIGLQGTVHIMTSVSRELAPDPRKDAGLYVWPAEPKIVLDPEGNIIEEVPNSAKPDAVMRIVRSADGCETSTHVTGEDSNFRTVIRRNANGWETLNYQNDKLANRSVHQKRGTGSVDITYDAAGKVINKVVTSTDQQQHVTHWRVTSNGTLMEDMRDTYDADGNLAVREEYGADGKLCASFSLGRDTSLQSWFADPTCKRNFSVGLVDSAQGRTVSYHLRNGGVLTTQHESHAGRRGNIEPDDMEVAAADGTVLEKLHVDYTRDAQGNWTRRVVSVLDTSTQQMIAVREDQREITYYGR